MKRFFITLLFPFLLSAAENTINLAGAWRYQLDRTDAGIAGNWYAKRLPHRVRVPVDLAAQGIGDEVTLQTPWTGDIIDQSFFKEPEYAVYRQPGKIKVPFWLQPEKQYRGPAWFQREIEIPVQWQGQRVALFIERPHWQTHVWVDEQPCGVHNALATPHVHELGAALSAGKHTLTIRIDNRMIVSVGENSHSVSDHTQGNWNGMVGRIELIATPPVWIRQLQVYPHWSTRSVLISGQIGNITGQAGQAMLDCTVNPGDRHNSALVQWDQNGGRFEVQISLGASAIPWDEFNPYLYQLTASLDHGADICKTTFGLRDISTQGTQFLLNGRKIYIRGTLECAIFPKTGHPPTDVGSWKRVMAIARAHGLNNLRFHSWCPPEAAFTAADELGFYLQVECSSWANSIYRQEGPTLGDGKTVDAWLYEEADRILACYGNHPSFMLMPYGNEPGGEKYKEYLAKWVEHYKAKDPRRLYTGASGWPKLAENQFHVLPEPRVQGWGQGLKSRINGQPPATVVDYRAFIAGCQAPVISHEIGQWCVYPNFREMKKYTGYLKPKNFEIFYDRLVEHGLQDQAYNFFMASGKLQTLCYKEEIEAALRTPAMGGFQLLDLHDFPGQGSALVGVLDPFWDEKEYVTAQEFRRFCNSTVLLARLPKRVFTNSDTLHADIEVAHFGPAVLPNEICTWRLLNEDKQPAAEGQLPAREIPLDNAVALGSIHIPLPQIPGPAKYKLALSLSNGKFENDWEVWIYPDRMQVPLLREICISHAVDDSLAAALLNGGKALLFIPPERVVPDKKRGPIALGFSCIFWNTAWTSGQAPHTLGIFCEPSHPALAAFPTEYHTNWQWWYLIHKAGAMILDDLPHSLKPIVSVVDDWFTARKLGLIFEAKVGRGKLLVCSIDLWHEKDNNPVSRQMLASLLNYMHSDKFAPGTELSLDQISSLIIL